MRAGKLDRRIRLERWEKTGTNALNEPIEGWILIKTVWAQQRPNRGAERFEAEHLSGQSVLTFHIRYRSDLTTKDRIIYEGRAYDIKDLREVGRRSVLEIDCTAGEV